MEEGAELVGCKGMNDVELEDEGQPEHQQEAHDVKCAFRYNSAHQLIGRHLFITGEDSTFYHFAEAGSAHIDEIADHDPQEKIDAAGFIAQRHKQQTPTESPQKKTSKKKKKDRYQQ